MKRSSATTIFARGGRTGVASALTLAAVLAASSQARADKDYVAPVTDPVAREECGACHMPYQPAFLPAESWQLIFSDLGDHFGEDASLDPETTARIRDYYMKNAARWRSVPSPAPIRISELRWFRHEHGRLIERAKRDPKVGSISNCVACHRGAEKGWFED